LAVVYTPASHTLNIALTNFSRTVSSRWFDPTANTFTAISGSPFANSGTHDFTTPGNNSAGDGDWVLLLEAQPPTAIAPQITSYGFSNNTFVVGFNTISGQKYEVQSRSDLATGSWLPVVTNIPGAGGIIQVPDTNAVSSIQRFYRIKTGF
jgi:hypothetical protein